MYRSGLFGIEMTDKAGILIGWDDTFDVLKPYDNCILIVPDKLKNQRSPCYPIWSTGFVNF